MKVNTAARPTKRAKMVETKTPDPEISTEQKNFDSGLKFGMLVRSGPKNLRAEVISGNDNISVLGTTVSPFTSENTKILKINLPSTDPLDKLYKDLHPQIAEQLQGNWPSQQPSLKGKGKDGWVLNPMFYLKPDSQYDPLLSVLVNPMSKVFVNGELNKDPTQWTNRTITSPVQIKLASVGFDPLQPVLRIYANFNLEEIHLGEKQENSSNNILACATTLNAEELDLAAVTNDRVTGFTAQIKHSTGSWVLISFKGNVTLPSFVVEPPDRGEKYTVKFPVSDPNIVSNLHKFHRNIEAKLQQNAKWPSNANLNPLVRQVTDTNGFLGQPFVNTKIKLENFSRIKFTGYQPEFVDGVPQLQGLQVVRYVILLNVVYVQKNGQAGYSCIPKEIDFSTQ